MKCLNALIKIREQRQKEIAEYKRDITPIFTYTQTEWNASVAIATEKNKNNIITCVPLQNIENALSKRHTLLTLELPFKTDGVNHNRSLVQLTQCEDECEDQCEDQKQYLLLDEQIDDWLDNYVNQGEYYDRWKIKIFFRNFFKRIWPRIAKIEYDQKGKSSAITQRADISDFTFDLIRSELFNAIWKLKLNENTKATYISAARALLSYCRHENIEYQFPKLGVTAEQLATYFEHLERRCLKKNDCLNAYFDLIEIRLLFYAPLTIKQLQQLTLKNIDIDKSKIQAIDSRFSIPKSFVQLALTLFPQDAPLFRKDAKKLNKFVEETAKAAGIRLNPTLIKRSLPFICHQEQFFPDLLPKR